MVTILHTASFPRNPPASLYPYSLFLSINSGVQTEGTVIEIGFPCILTLHDFAAKKTPFLFLVRLSFSDCLSSPNRRTNTCKCLCPRERLFVRRHEPWMLTVPVDHEL